MPRKKERRGDPDYRPSWRAQKQLLQAERENAEDETTEQDNTPATPVSSEEAFDVEQLRQQLAMAELQVEKKKKKEDELLRRSTEPPAFSSPERLLTSSDFDELMTTLISMWSELRQLTTQLQAMEARLKAIEKKQLQK